ncbi:unnamed protein product, partial [Hapterophycus canaliculatus]
QALGRCIRHIYDYGVICLIDERFRLGATTHVKYLAKWMRGLLGEYSSLAEMGDTMDKVRRGLAAVGPSSLAASHCPSPPSV